MLSYCLSVVILNISMAVIQIYINIYWVKISKSCDVSLSLCSP